MTALALIVACLAGAPAPLPEDPVERVAAKALRGDYGKLEPFQKAGYTKLSKGQYKTHRVWLTAYSASEGKQGEVDARGRRCTIETLACNKFPLGTVVFVPSESRMRRVLDRGAKSNDRIAKRKGAAFWADRWMPGPRWNNVSSVTDLLVVR